MIALYFLLSALIALAAAFARAAPHGQTAGRRLLPRPTVAGRSHRRRRLRRGIVAVLPLRRGRHALLRAADDRLGLRLRPLVRLPARQSDQGVSSLLHAADAAHHGHHGRILRPQHRRDVDLPRSHDPLRRRHRLPPPHGAGARSDVEIHLRLLGRHRHGLSGHPAALVAGRRFAALRGAGAQRRRRQPALPENRLSADPLRLQLQDGDFPRSTRSASTPISPRRHPPQR